MRIHLITILVKVYFVTLKSSVPRKIFTLTPTLSQRERASGSLSLWERVGVRVKYNSKPHEKSYYLDPFNVTF